MKSVFIGGPLDGYERTIFALPGVPWTFPETRGAIYDLARIERQEGPNGDMIETAIFEVRRQTS